MLVMVSAIDITLNQLQWSETTDADRRFMIIASVMIAVFILVGGIVPFVDLPASKIEYLSAEPDRLARVVMTPVEMPEPTPMEPPEVMPEAVEEFEAKPVTDEDLSDVDRAKAEAQGSGVLQFKDSLLSLRDSFDLSKVDTRSRRAGESKAAEIDRSIIVSESTQVSDGIDLASLSRDTGGVALAAQEATKVQSQLAKQIAEQDSRKRENSETRSEEQIREVMEQNKGAIFIIYHRALRTKPNLQGKFTVKIVIEPSEIGRAHV